MVSVAHASLSTMKILHTSDWHIGRTFHGNSTLDSVRIVFGALVAAVYSHGVDVVVVSGDIFDSATPAAEHFELLGAVLADIRAAGARVMLTSGNHDSATRLGFTADFTGSAGVHIFTRAELLDRPVSIDDAHGPVHFYGIPYLEPALVRHRFALQNPVSTLTTHEQVLDHAMNRIRVDLAGRGGRSVVIAHAFIADIPAAEPATGGLERDITSGGLDLVPLTTFDGPDYVALGHIHGRAILSERARYSGAPLHYSFGEARKPRGAWLVSLDASALDTVQWIDFPVPRRLTVLTGELEDLLFSAENSEFTADWISAILTDRVRPMDAMRRLQSRFMHTATLEHRPNVLADPGSNSYGQRIAARTDHEIVDGFLELVRNGVGANELERQIIASAISHATRSSEQLQ